MTFPTDYTAFIQLLVNPITFGMLLTWFLGHVPIIKNEDVTNWLKFVVAVVASFLWSFLVTLFTKGLPQSPAEWYTVVQVGLAITFANQAFYQIVTNLPEWAQSFLQIFFGKSQTVATFTATPGAISTVLTATSSDPTSTTVSSPVG